MSKNGFLLYGNYEEQVKRLNDAQAGELFKIILHYVNTGEMRKSSDALVDMVFSMIAFQLGFDMKRYEESCEKRREAGRKAGKASAEKRAKAKQEMKASANVNDCQQFQHDTDTEIDTVTETDIDIETDTEKYNKTSRHPHHSSKGAGASEDVSMDEVIPYGENQNPTTRGELAQMEALAGELIRKYCGRAAYENDVQNVFNKCYTVAELPNGELYAAYSPERAELLRYAFKQAGNAGSVNWKYIEGIYDNFEKRRIKTVEEAVQKEYAWQRGEIA